MVNKVDDSVKFSIKRANPDDIFDEWTAYAEKQALKPRQTDLSGIQKDATLKIIAITGVRRAGKTSVLMLLHKMLASRGEKTGYINLEDSRLKGQHNVLDKALKWFGDSGYLLLDEVTAADEWEGWLARAHEMLKGNLRLIVSSSRKTLSSPQKPLRGRMLPVELYPLSFREFLDFTGIPVEKTTAGRGRLERALQEYLVYGGFPEVVLTSNRTDKTRLLNSYFRDIIGLDVADMSGESISAVELFGEYVIESSYFSASKCLHLFKSVGYKIGKQSIFSWKDFQRTAISFSLHLFSPPP